MKINVERCEELFDCLAVNLKTHRVRILDRDKTRSNAEAVVDMAVIRRGVDEEYFTIAPTGKFKDGDLR